MNVAEYSLVEGYSVFLCIILDEVMIMPKAVEAPKKSKLAVTIDDKMKRKFAQICEDIGLPIWTLTALRLGKLRNFCDVGKK